MMPKERGMIVVNSENNELIPKRTMTRWRMCIDYKRLDDATRNDQFPFLFIDQMLERLGRHAYYYFLDDNSSYDHIVVAPKDQEKMTFTHME